MTARTIAIVSAGLGQPSSTRLLADRLAAATRNHLEAQGIDVTLEVVELRETARDVTDNLLTGFANAKLAKVIDTVTGADALIAVTPIFTTSFSGLFKSFIDVIDPSALRGMPVLIGATAGTERHSLALDYALRPMFTYLHAIVAPTGVFAASSDWGSETTGLADRIDRAAAEFAELVERSDRSSVRNEPFALPPGFSPRGAFSAYQ